MEGALDLGARQRQGVEGTEGVPAGSECEEGTAFGDHVPGELAGRGRGVHILRGLMPRERSGMGG